MKRDKTRRDEMRREIYRLILIWARQIIRENNLLARFQTSDSDSNGTQVTRATRFLFANKKHIYEMEGDNFQPASRTSANSLSLSHQHLESSKLRRQRLAGAGSGAGRGGASTWQSMQIIIMWLPDHDAFVSLFAPDKEQILRLETAGLADARAEAPGSQLSLQFERQNSGTSERIHLIKLDFLLAQTCKFAYHCFNHANLN